MDVMTKFIASGNLSSPESNSVNVMRLFPVSSRHRRDHDHRRYSPPNSHNSSQDFLHQSVQLTRKILNQGFIETRLDLHLKSVLVVTII